MKKILLILLILSSLVFAQSETKLFIEGNRLYKEKQFNEAIEKYRFLI